MPRFYCPPPLPLSGSFDLPPDAAHHAARVLRLREGDAVQIFDGNGNEWQRQRVPRHDRRDWRQARGRRKHSRR